MLMVVFVTAPLSLAGQSGGQKRTACVDRAGRESTTTRTAEAWMPLCTLSHTQHTWMPTASCLTVLAATHLAGRSTGTRTQLLFCSAC